MGTRLCVLVQSTTTKLCCKYVLHREREREIGSGGKQVRRNRINVLQIVFLVIIIKLGVC